MTAVVARYPPLLENNGLDCHVMAGKMKVSGMISALVTINPVPFALDSQHCFVELWPGEPRTDAAQVEVRKGTTLPPRCRSTPSLRW